MVKPDPKRDRLAKLLRLAANKEGAENERVTAALAAAALFVELEDKSNADKREAKIKAAQRGAAGASSDIRYDAHGEPEMHYATDYAEDRPPPQTHEPDVGAWHKSMSGLHDRNCPCVSCRIPIGIGASVWRRVNAGCVEWVHDNCPRPGATGI